MRFPGRVRPMMACPELRPRPDIGLTEGANAPAVRRMLVEARTSRAPHPPD